MIQAAEALAQEVPVSCACEALAFPRSSLYRARQPRTDTKKPPRPSPPRALSQAEKDAVYTVLNGERFQDSPPRQVYATLLDEGVYHCSISTMFRTLHEHDQVHERRDQRQHPCAGRKCTSVLLLFPATLSRIFQPTLTGGRIRIFGQHSSRLVRTRI